MFPSLDCLDAKIPAATPRTGNFQPKLKKARIRKAQSDAKEPKAGGNEGCPGEAGPSKGTGEAADLGSMERGLAKDDPEASPSQPDLQAAASFRRLVPKKRQAGEGSGLANVQSTKGKAGMSQGTGAAADVGSVENRLIKEDPQASPSELALQAAASSSQLVPEKRQVGQRRSLVNVEAAEESGEEGGLIEFPKGREKGERFLKSLAGLPVKDEPQVTPHLPALQSKAACIHVVLDQRERGEGVDLEGVEYAGIAIEGWVERQTLLAGHAGLKLTPKLEEGTQEENRHPPKFEARLRDCETSNEVWREGRHPSHSLGGLETPAASNDMLPKGYSDSQVTARVRMHNVSPDEKNLPCLGSESLLGSTEPFQVSPKDWVTWRFEDGGDGGSGSTSKAWQQLAGSHVLVSKEGNVTLPNVKLEACETSEIGRAVPSNVPVLAERGMRVCDLNEEPTSLCTTEDWVEDQTCEERGTGGTGEKLYHREGKSHDSILKKELSPAPVKEARCILKGSLFCQEKERIPALILEGGRRISALGKEVTSNNPPAEESMHVEKAVGDSVGKLQDITPHDMKAEAHDTGLGSASGSDLQKEQRNDQLRLGVEVNEMSRINLFAEKSMAIKAGGAESVCELEGGKTPRDVKTEAGNTGSACLSLSKMQGEGKSLTAKLEAEVNSTDPDHEVGSSMDIKEAGEALACKLKGREKTPHDMKPQAGITGTPCMSLSDPQEEGRSFTAKLKAEVNITEQDHGLCTPVDIEEAGAALVCKWEGEKAPHGVKTQGGKTDTAHLSLSEVQEEGRSETVKLVSEVNGAEHNHGSRSLMDIDEARGTLIGKMEQEKTPHDAEAEAGSARIACISPPEGQECNFPVKLEAEVNSKEHDHGLGCCIYNGFRSDVCTERMVVGSPESLLGRAEELVAKDSDLCAHMEYKPAAEETKATCREGASTTPVECDVLAVDEQATKGDISSRSDAPVLKLGGDPDVDAEKLQWEGNVSPAGEVERVVDDATTNSEEIEDTRRTSVLDDEADHKGTPVLQIGGISAEQEVCTGVLVSHKQKQNIPEDHAKQVSDTEDGIGAISEEDEEGRCAFVDDTRLQVGNMDVPAVPIETVVDEEEMHNRDSMNSAEGVLQVDLDEVTKHDGQTEAQSCRSSSLDAEARPVSALPEPPMDEHALALGTNGAEELDTVICGAISEVGDEENMLPIISKGAGEDGPAAVDSLAVNNARSRRNKRQHAGAKEALDDISAAVTLSKGRRVPQKQKVNQTKKARKGVKLSNRQDTDEADSSSQGASEDSEWSGKPALKGRGGHTKGRSRGKVTGSKQVDHTKGKSTSTYSAQKAQAHQCGNTVNKGNGKIIGEGARTERGEKRDAQGRLRSRKRSVQSDDEISAAAAEPVDNVEHPPPKRRRKVPHGYRRSLADPTLRQKRAELDFPVEDETNPAKMTFRGIIRKFTMSEKEKAREEARLKTQEKDSTQANAPVVDLEARKRQAAEEAMALMAPQVQVVDGRIVINEASLTASANVSRMEEQFYTRVDESTSFLNYRTYANWQTTERWSAGETDLFYKGLRHFGTEFSFISQLFPRRTRAQIRNKFRAEERRNPRRVADAVTSKTRDASKFEEMLKLMEAFQNEAPSLGEERNDNNGAFTQAAGQASSSKARNMETVEEENEEGGREKEQNEGGGEGVGNENDKRDDEGGDEEEFHEQGSDDMAEDIDYEPSFSRRQRKPFSDLDHGGDDDLQGTGQSSMMNSSQPWSWGGEDDIDAYY